MSSTIICKSITAAAMVSALVAMPTIASAADLLVDPPIVEAPEVITQPAGGWYLRGDITYDFHSDFDEPHYSVPGGTEVDFKTSDLDDAFDLGIGIGYQVNENFRVDLTGEYVFDADFTGSTMGFCNDAAFAAGEMNCVSEDTDTYSALKLLANAYVDLGNYNGFTPYVGAGIGGAYVSWDGLTNATTCTQISVECPNGGNTGYAGDGSSSSRTDNHDGEDSWRFAWALHAGFAYDISQNVKLDLGYTYSHIEGGEMFSWLDGSGTQGYDEGIDSHVIRAGIRYQIW